MKNIAIIIIAIVVASSCSKDVDERTVPEFEPASLDSLGGTWKTVHLASSAYLRLEQLPETVQADVRTSIGFNTLSEEVLAQTGITDTWNVVAQSLEKAPYFRAVLGKIQEDDGAADGDMAIGEDAAKHLGISIGDEAWVLPLD